MSVGIPPNENPITWLDGRYALVNQGGATRVYDREMGYYLRPLDLTTLYAATKIPMGEREIGVGAFWLNHHLKPTYVNGVGLFAGTTKTPEGYLNSWRGWGIEAKQGDWSKFETHLRDVICSGNDEHYNYLADWIAWGLQNPAKIPKTAVVLRGGQGTGKGIVAAVLGAIYSKHHTVKLTQASSFTGKFAGHLEKAMFVFADEAFFAGQKSEHGRLKALITEPEILIEPKNLTSVMCKNHMRVLLASNSDWVVPVEADDRRFFVLDVSDEHAQSDTWFTPIWQQMFTDTDTDTDTPGAGTAAFFHAMLKRDISGFKPHKFPRTAAHAAQKVLSMGMVEQWWYEVLSAPSLPYHVTKRLAEAGGEPTSWPEGRRAADKTSPTANFVPATPLFEAFNDWASDRKISHRTTYTAFGKIMRRLAIKGRTAKARGYKLGSRRECAEAFKKHLGINSLAALDLDEPDEGATQSGDGDEAMTVTVLKLLKPSDEQKQQEGNQQEGNQ